MRRGIGLWKRVYLEEAPVVADDALGDDPVLTRGRYLVEGPGHCGECHTPRTVIQAMRPDAVYRGAGGILSADLSGRLVIDMSTVLPATAEAIAAEVKAKGAAFAECPVGGTVGPAREGKLFGLVVVESEEVIDAYVRNAGIGSSVRIHRVLRTLDPALAAPPTAN